MGQIVLDPALADQILQSIEMQKQAELFKGSVDAPKEVSNLNSISLATAKLATAPQVVSFPFKSVYAFDGSDSSTYVYIVPWTNDGFQDPIKIKVNDSWTCGKIINKAYMYWPAQAGKNISLSFFHNSEFRSGSYTSVSAGGVSINEGSTFAMSVAPTTAGSRVSVSQNFNRKVYTVYNDSGGYLYAGTVGTVTGSGAAKGIPIAPGAFWYWKNTAAIDLYADATGNIVVMEET
jgi:hypothetical protein